MNRVAVAKELVSVARELEILAVEEDVGEQEDPQFAQKVRDLKMVMQKLIQRKNRRLKQFGISDMIRPNNTVEDLVDAMRRCTS
jgi:CelD/BcsL family acetyltransferase involved in cellulose biosynthesis